MTSGPRPFTYVPKQEMRLPKGRIVTIAAGILCQDGIVLCADTEESITDDRKGTTSKLSLVLYTSRKGEEAETFHKIQDSSRNQPWVSRSDWSIGIAGAGHADWITAFVQG